MKPFSIELAKQGKPICTRDGRKAIFLTTLSNKNFPVVAIVSCGQEENVYQYDINGVCDEHDNNLDLMMLPEKKEMWINIYKVATNFIPGGHLYSTEKIARDIGEGDKYYVTTTKVCWEE